MKASFAFSGGRGVGGSASWLGNICHRVLEDSLTSGWISKADREIELDRCWHKELARWVDGLRLRGVSPDLLEPRGWPGYELKRARLGNCVRRLHELVGSLPSDRQLLTEEPLVAREGRLQGRPDLIVRSREAHMVVDYKTGAIFEVEGETPKEAYKRQLQLYAAMEAETSGAWPTKAELLPLHGPAAEVQIEPAECHRLADEAVELLDSYNRGAPHSQPPTVSLETCPDCVFASRCPAFWSHVDGSFASRVLATAGTVVSIRDTPLGGLSLNIAVETGSVDEAQIVVRNIDSSAILLTEEPSEGDFVTVFGLRREAGRSTYRLTAFGQLHRLGEGTGAHESLASSAKGTAP